MLTMTVRHAVGHSLKGLRSGLARAWRRLWQGRAGVERKERWRILHSVRALEVTHGDNGWHPHLHVVLFQAAAEHSPAAVDELREAWAHAVAVELGPSCVPSDARGVDARPLQVARYLTKLGLEVASIGTKRGRRSSRTPWEIAHDGAAGDAASRGLWQSYTRAMKGARQLFWSRGARRFFGLGRERADEDLARDGVGVLLAEWSGEEWDRLCRAFPRWLSLVTAAVAAGTLSELPRSTGPPSSYSSKRVAVWGWDSSTFTPVQSPTPGIGRPCTM